MPSEIVRQAEAFKRQLARSTAATERYMARQWLTVEQELAERIRAVAKAAKDAQDRGEDVTEATLWRLDRYQELQNATQGEIDRYLNRQEANIEGWTRDRAEQGRDEAIGLIKAAKSPYADAMFARLPVEAIEYMAGTLHPGTPLHNLLAKGYPLAQQGMRDALLKAVAAGDNPRTTARKMRDGLGAGFDRALLISRTEQMRAYRLTSVQTYRDSGVVEGFKRLAARNARTCMACLASDGEVFRLEQEFTDHPNGRCTAVPAVIGAPPLSWETGQDWFQKQGKATQRDMMGARYFEEWARGAFSLGDLRSTTHNRTWGDSPQVTPLGQIVPDWLERYQAARAEAETARP